MHVTGVTKKIEIKVEYRVRKPNINFYKGGIFPQNSTWRVFSIARENFQLFELDSIKFC